MSFFNNMFYSRSKIDFTSLLSNGAILLDVRTKEEYRAGHVENSSLWCPIRHSLPDCGACSVLVSADY